MEQLREDYIVNKAINNTEIRIGFSTGDDDSLDRYFAEAEIGGTVLVCYGFSEDEAVASLIEDLRAYFLMNLSRAKEMAIVGRLR